MSRFLVAGGITLLVAWKVWSTTWAAPVQEQFGGVVRVVRDTHELVENANELLTGAKRIKIESLEIIVSVEDAKP